MDELYHDGAASGPIPRAPAEPPPREHRRSAHAIIDALLPLALTLLGLLAERPAAWFESLAFSFAVLALPVLGGSLAVTLLAKRFGDRIQGPRRVPALIAREAFESARAMFVAACFMAWPLTQWRLGHATGLVRSLDTIGGTVGGALLQTLLGVVAMDAWLYWKHRLLHTGPLFGFHKAHHAFRDPTAFASFAVGPVESVLTFWPILLLCLPWATHWAPLYFTLVVLFVNLNFYLHCGVTLGWVEKTLPRAYLNTSAFHNVHHARANVHFGEALYLWDAICKTRLVDQPKSVAS
jgi:sterol desaturase/sphingolipid hydroxylase (fatty acid hydroxylase superfamily)